MVHYSENYAHECLHDKLIMNLGLTHLQASHKCASNVGRKKLCGGSNDTRTTKFANTCRVSFCCSDDRLRFTPQYRRHGDDDIMIDRPGRGWWSTVRRVDTCGAVYRFRRGFVVTRLQRGCLRPPGAPRRCGTGDYSIFLSRPGGSRVRSQAAD